MYSLKPRRSFHNLFVALAVVVALISLFLSDRLARELAEEEHRKMEIWAVATGSMADNGEASLDLVLKILQSNTTIPVILLDAKSGELLSHNIRLPSENSKSYLEKKIMQFGKKHDPIVLEGPDQLLYYDDSYTLKQLQIYPYFQLLVIAFLIGLAFSTLSSSQRAEQHRVWVGLSKETAHQLGTPISSLVAWTEYLRLKEVDPELLKEINKDVERLQIIADRFSKIGSASLLEQSDMREVVKSGLSYLRNRIPEKITFNLRFPEQPVLASLNEPLFGWVVENLVKNAVDAMQGEGVVTFVINEKEKEVILDVADAGKGIQKSSQQRIFTPGYTTKERGWGLGLSLVKRIVEVNHHGKIYLLKSELGKGTVIRIVLKKNPRPRRPF
jgi:two-component sensor histidine kinase